MYKSIIHTSGIFKLIDAPEKPEPNYLHITSSLYINTQWYKETGGYKDPIEWYEAALQQAIERGIQIVGEIPLDVSLALKAKGKVFPLPESCTYYLVDAKVARVLSMNGEHKQMPLNGQVAYLIPISEVVPVEEKKELTPKDAGYKWFTCDRCEGSGKISQDQFNQSAQPVEQLTKEQAISEAMKETKIGVLTMSPGMEKCIYKAMELYASQFKASSVQKEVYILEALQDGLRSCASRFP